jgi:hypothetical protein
VVQLFLFFTALFKMCELSNRDSGSTKNKTGLEALFLEVNSFGVEIH